MSLMLSRDGRLPGQSMVVVQYDFEDGTRGYEIILPGEPLNSRAFDGPGATARLLRPGDQCHVFVKEEDQPLEGFRVSNIGGEPHTVLLDS